MRCYDTITLCELLEEVIPFFSCGRYACLICFIGKCECFECRDGVVWFKFSITEATCYTELICSTDIAVIPHILIDVREAPLSAYFGQSDITCTEENSEYFSTCDIVFDTIRTISVAICESLTLQVEH